MSGPVHAPWADLPEGTCPVCGMHDPEPLVPWPYGWPAHPECVEWMGSQPLTGYVALPAGAPLGADRRAFALAAWRYAPDEWLPGMERAFMRSVCERSAGPPASAIVTIPEGLMSRRQMDDFASAVQATAANARPIVLAGGRTEWVVQHSSARKERRG